jgi:hypothetical protein
VAEGASPRHLDLSAELFGGVAATCGAGGAPGLLDRDRCCPVLAIWLFAARRLIVRALGARPGGGTGAQRCVDALGAALGKRLVPLPLPKATCDTVFLLLRHPAPPDRLAPLPHHVLRRS